jgi:hypothetical protein
MPPKTIVRELQFPLAGVARRMRVHGETGQRKGMYPTPWAANVWPQDPTAKRLRGGSRTGLTKLHASDLGTTISDMVPVQMQTGEILVTLVDSSFVKLESGSLTSTSGGPSSGFLVHGDQKVYAVHTGGVTVYKPGMESAAALEASAGTLPTGHTHGAVHRGRLFVAGGSNLIHCSKMDDVTNWDLGVDVSNTRRAKRFQLSKASEVGGTCTALVPHEDGTMLLATAKSLWVLQGDPVLAGPREVSPYIGIIDKRAWCNVHGSVVFLSENGLYRVDADGDNLESIGRDAMPAELLDVDTSTTTVQGIFICRKTSGTDVHWFYHLPTESFWPLELQSDHEPQAICRYAGDLILGGSDGYLRKVSGSDDDGTNIESHVLIGPIRIGGHGAEGMVRELVAALGVGSGTVNWRLILSDTAEEAAADGKAAIEAFQAGNSYASYVAEDGSWVAGWNYPDAPRRSTLWAVIWLQSTATWSYENITLETAKHRRWE